MADSVDPTRMRVGVAFLNGGLQRQGSCRKENVNSRLPPAAPRIPSQRPATAIKVCHTPVASASGDHAGKNRIRLGSVPNKTPKEVAPVRRANRRLLESPAPTVGVRKNQPLPPTLSRGFSLRTVERAVSHEKQKPAQEAFEDLRQHFQALSSPTDYTTATLPKKAATTAVQPFRFETDRIDKEYKEKQRKKLEQEEAERRKAMEFRAKAMPNFRRPVFHPVLQDRHVTEAQDVQLTTSKRLEERKQFDAYVRSKEEERKEALRQRENEKQRLEEEKLRKLRIATVHHPVPVKRNKPFQIKHHNDHVTIPVSPKFRIDDRLLQRPPSRNQ